jgi:hypothetical protein
MRHEEPLPLLSQWDRQEQLNERGCIQKAHREANQLSLDKNSRQLSPIKTGAVLMQQQHAIETKQNTYGQIDRKHPHS